MSTPVELKAAQTTAAEEKALAKQRLADLKASLKPSAIVGRLGRRTGARATSATSAISDAVRAHPVATASVIACGGLLLAAKPIGDYLADEFDWENMV